MPNLCNKRDSLQSLLRQIAVVTLGPVPLPLKLKGCILLNRKAHQSYKRYGLRLLHDIRNNRVVANLGHVLAMQMPVCFCPLNLTRVPLHLEVFMAL